MIHILVEGCRCNLEGTKNSSMSCDANTGQCDCNCAIEGLACDTCTDMHYNFPNCEDNRKKLSVYTNEYF